MNFYPEERLGIFVDGANLYGAARSLNFDIDYRKMLELFAKQGRLVRAFYYTALPEEQEYSPMRPSVRPRLRKWATACSKSPGAS